MSRAPHVIAASGNVRMLWAVPAPIRMQCVGCGATRCLVLGQSPVEVVRYGPLAGVTVAAAFAMEHRYCAMKIVSEHPGYLIRTKF